MNKSTKLILFLMILAMGLFFSNSETTQAQQSSSETNRESEKSAKQAEQSLKDVQTRISGRYQRFAKTLTQLHGYMKKSDPARAELLLRVIGKSKEAQIDSQMASILQLLSEDSPQFANVVGRQEDLIKSLLNLLDVLQSEDEQKRLNDEIARLEELIGDLNKIVVNQKEVRAGTERGRPLDSLESKQKDVESQTEKLADKIDKQDREKQKQNEKEKENLDQDGKPQDGKPQDGKPQDGKPQDGKPQDGKPQDGKPQDGKPQDGKPQDGKPQDGKPQDGKPQDGKPQDGKPQDGKPQDGKPQDGKPQDGKPQQQKPEETPGREEVENALDKMKKAIEDLKKKNRDNAARDQDQAIAELEKAKAKLEEILRQLREEEQKIMLAALEARFRKMLQMQVTIRKSSQQIAQIEPDKRLPRHRARSIQLARDEQDIVQEANKALILLREEGSSVAFPEAVQAIREDMQTTTKRLNEFQVDELTIAIEDDIIEALEEMVEALRKEMEKLEEGEKQKQQQGEPQDPALVDLIAELKLLRSLQIRINRRTERYGKPLKGEQVVKPDVLELLDQLSERQARIQRATYDLSTGRNK